MKRIIAMLMLIAVGCMAKAQSQGYIGKYWNATQFMKSPIYFIGYPTVTDTAASKKYVRDYISSLGIVNYWTANGINIYSNNMGRVGIGTATPLEKFHVVGNTTIESERYMLINDEYSDTIMFFYGQKLLFDHKDYGVKVGIGTRNPTSKLDVNGTFNCLHYHQNGELRDTANASHAGFMSKHSYNKLQSIVGGSSWTTSGNNIYNSNSGNVGINNATPSYKLDVGGLIGGSNIETNPTTNTTRLGRSTGTAEDKSSDRSNVFVGNSSGNHVTTGIDNTFIGTATGTSLTTGNSNVFLGRSSGYRATGNYNVMLGNFSGYQSTGSNNTCVGYLSGSALTSGGSNTYLGNYSVVS